MDILSIMKCSTTSSVQIETFFGPNYTYLSTNAVPADFCS
jgi:hypothetical protein